jgi:hypothetical protein
MMRYEPASSSPRATGCQPGTRALAQAIKVTFPELESLSQTYGCFNRRRMAGSTSWSLHAEGRAVDVGFAERHSGVGWSLACELVAHRMAYGIMRVMWDGHIWSIERGGDWQRLRTTSDQHRSHIHAEQFWTGALRPASSQAGMQTMLAASRV